jgi:DICT domain-containing protein
MAKVISLKVATERRDVTVEQAWQRYVDAMQRSKETLRIEDGIAAGRAYRQFLEMYARNP